MACNMRYTPENGAELYDFNIRIPILHVKAEEGFEKNLGRRNRGATTISIVSHLSSDHFPHIPHTHHTNPMTFKRQNHDPFKNLSLSAKDILDTPDETKTVKSKNGSKYVDLGSNAKPARPFSVFMIYTIMTIILSLHAVFGMLSVVWIFIEYMSQKATIDPNGNEQTARVVSFCLNTLYHLFRTLVYFVAIPFGCVARPPLFVLGVVAAALCIAVDVIVIGLYALDRIIKTDISKYFAQKLTVQQYVSYLCLDVLYIVVVVFFVLAIVRYRSAMKMYKRSVLLP